MEPSTSREPQVFGRATILDQAEQLLSRPAPGGACLVISGARGMGKTVLLEAACARAARSSARVVRVDLAASIGASTSLLACVAAATGQPDGPELQARSGSGLAEGNRLLGLLSTGDDHPPQLLAIDDAHLLTPADQSTLAFVCRRLNTTPTSVLVSTLPGHTPLDHAGLATEALAPLDPAAARALLAGTFEELGEETASRVVAEAAGIPLALVELPAALDDRQRAGHLLTSLALPLTTRLRDVYGSGLDSLTPPLRRLLQLLAVAGPLNDTLVLAAARAWGPPLSSVEVATIIGGEALGLVERTPEGRLHVATTALLRNVVVDATSSAQLGEIRSALAAAWTGDRERQVWHRAAGVVGVDAALADDLEAAAQAATRRGEVDHAVRAMVRAAELTPVASESGRRLLAAAQLRTNVTGELAVAAHHLDRAESIDPPSAGTLHAALTRAQLSLAGGGSLDHAHDQLANALASTPPQDDADPVTIAAFQLLFYLSVTLAQPAPWSTYRVLVERIQPRVGRIQQVIENVVPDVTRADRQTIEDVRRAVLGIHELTDPTEVIRVSVAAFHLDQMAGCRATLTRLATDAHRGRMTSAGAEALLRLALDDCFTGQLERAETFAREGLRLTLALGQQERAWTFELCLGLISAMRGDAEQVHALTSSMSAYAVPRRALLVDHHCAHVQGLLALGRGDFESAYRHAVSINPPGVFNASTSLSVWSGGDLVEAAAATGRPAEAAAHAAALRDTGLARVSTRLAFRVATATAAAAPDSNALDHFAAALAMDGVDRWPFEVARGRLAYGERLHQLRRSSEAQGHLVEAYETFRMLRIGSWAHRAAEAMRAAGLPMPATERPEAPTLTTRERAIADLAASGLSNREIGARMFLSPRTVSSQLYRIFPKFGITSRAGLRDALATLPDEQLERLDQGSPSASRLTDVEEDPPC